MSKLPGERSVNFRRTRVRDWVADDGILVNHGMASLPSGLGVTRTNLMRYRMWRTMLVLKPMAK